MLNKKVLRKTIACLLTLGFFCGNNLLFAKAEADMLSPEMLAGRVLEKMTLEEKIGQLFMLDFRKNGGKDVVAINRNIADAIKKYKPGGIILFRENCTGTEQLRLLVSDFQSASPEVPLLIGIDQEGGVVTRLQSGTVMPGNMALGATGDTALTRQAAIATGEELRSLGINMNFAPVVDVNINQNNPVIGVRSFGDNSVQVTRLGTAYMQGLQETGVIAVAKHFPGHGDTAVDSHIDLPSVPYDISRLEQVELKPYYKLIEENIDVIMSAHVTFPAIEDAEGVPATLSKKVLTGLLRNKMGFQGVIITDAFNMKAIADRFGEGKAAAMVIQAGGDIILMPQDVAGTLEYIKNEVQKGNIEEARINASVIRILMLKIKSGIISGNSNEWETTSEGAAQTVGSSEHRQLAQKIADSAITLIKNEKKVLPLTDEKYKKIVYFIPSVTNKPTVDSALDNINNGVNKLQIQGFSYEGLLVMNEAQKKAVNNCDVALFFSRTSKAADLSAGGNLAAFASSLSAYSGKLGKPVIGVAVRNPYDIMRMPQVNAYVAIYTDWKGGGVEAAVKCIFGEFSPIGKLPVNIRNDQGDIIYPNGYSIGY